jgi:hypothetical protein
VAGTVLLVAIISANVRWILARAAAREDRNPPGECDLTGGNGGDSGPAPPALPPQRPSIVVVVDRPARREPFVASRDGAGRLPR